MQKKILAVVLSGMLVFGAGMSVYAADAAESEATAEGGVESLLGGLMSSLGSDEESLDGLLSSLGGEEGSLDGLLSSLGGEGGSLDGLLSSLGGEGGSLDELLSSLGVDEESLEGLLSSLGEEGGSLEGLLSSLGVEGGSLDEILSSLGGEGGSGALLGMLLGSLDLDLSAEELAGLGEALDDPEAEKLLSGLFTEDGIGTSILDMIGSEDNSLGTLLGSMKSEEGGYDIDKIIKGLEGAEEKEGSIVIDGTEVSQEEIRDAVTEVLGMFGLSGGTKAA